jgi:hypothetical protein
METTNEKAQQLLEAPGQGDLIYILKEGVKHVQSDVGM